MIWRDVIQATATYDKANKKVYATIKGDVPFSIGDDVVIINGSSFLATVEAFERMGDVATISIDIDDWEDARDYLFNFISEQEVLLKALSKSKPLVKPYATIDLPAGLEALTIFSELKEQIASGTLPFAQAVIGLDTSSQVTLKIDSGNSKITAETFCVDKVKANISTKGLYFSSERTRRGQVFTSDQPVRQVFLLDYLQKMREELREQEPSIFLRYTATVVDDKLNVVVNKKPIKEVLTFKKDGKRGHRIKFEDQLINWPTISGTYTLLIEKETVSNTDYLDWTGSSGMSAPYLNSWQIFNQESPLEVKYVKKHIDGLAFLELDRSLWTILNSKIVSLTVDGNKTIIGAIQLTEGNKVILTKPKEMGQSVWAKDLAAFQYSGEGFINSLEVGSLAKDETLQLRVGLNNVATAWGYLQSQPTIITVDQLLTNFGPLEVTDVAVAAAKAGVKALTAVATLDNGTVKWFNGANYFEIVEQNDSRETFTMCNSNGADEGFQIVGVARLLDTAVLEIKDNYNKELQDIINPTPTVFAGAEIQWTADFQVKDEILRLVLLDAEVIQRNTSKTTYKFYYDQGIAQKLLLDNVTDGQIVLNVTRREYIPL